MQNKNRKLPPHPFPTRAMIKRIKKFILQLILKEKAIKGKLEAFFEQGMEEIAWSFSPETTKSKEYPLFLENGDFLIIYSLKNPKRIVWKGKISFYNQAKGQSYQWGVSKERWEKFFKKEYPAVLLKKAEQSKTSP